MTLRRRWSDSSPEPGAPEPSAAESSVAGPEAAPPPTLAGRINRLFEVHHPPESPEREYRNSEVVAQCRAAGRDISDTALSELRRGVKRNPSMRVLQTLAWFFHINPAYFFDDAAAQTIERELAEREDRLQRAIERDRRGREDLRQAALELQDAIRASGATKVAHRGINSRRSPAEQARMMRKLAAFLLEEDDEEYTVDEELTGGAQP